MENFQTTFNSNTTSANEALKSLGSFFKTEETKLQEIRTGLKTDHESFQATLPSQVSQLKDELLKETNLKDSLTLKSEEAKVLSTKLEALEQQVNDLLSETEDMRSCITDVTGMLSDIIETRDSMITITMRKHLVENLRPVFAMPHRVEGVSDQSFHRKQGGEGVVGGSRKEEAKAPVKLVVKKEPKLKEKLFSDDPILHNEEEEEPDRKIHGAELDEHQRIIHEAEEKERAE
ncbi:unnamed protein product [Lactuca virosa]|uniref:Uncharacterized protein n=1 Tax=Lactuca virosa TaxID=75947 RepID=A0AAU9NQ76_9ASTR|nr:unnamed protein product [Lactuca virosa]